MNGTRQKVLAGLHHRGREKKKEKKTIMMSNLEQLLSNEHIAWSEWKEVVG